MTSAPQPERFRRQAISPEEAQARILRLIQPLEAETVALHDAWSRRLAEPIASPEPVPAFRRSAMDGYAVRAADLPAPRAAEPVTLEVLESLPAGAVPMRSIGCGQASRIMTGAMLPDGADTVVMLEMTETAELAGRACVRIGKPVPQGHNVAAIGSELQAGEQLFAPGRLIAAGEVSLLAALGFSQVPVLRRPRVAVLSTGSELLPVDAPLVPGKIRNSNSPMLAALLREAGADPVMLGHVPDDTDAAERCIRHGISGCDLMITTGGVSVGDSDIIVDILARWEGTTLFNKVAMRPGSPTTAAELNGKLLLALSGNPGACFVGFHLFAVPALRAMQHVDPPQPALFQARLAEPFSKINAYPRYIRSRIELRDGCLWVRPTGADQSGVMKTILEADCLTVIPPLQAPLPAGAPVMAIRLLEGVHG